MFVPEALKVNKFVDVAIPSNKDYFARLGKQSLGDSQYTGDMPAVMPQSKIDAVTEEEQRLYDEMRQAEINSGKED